MAGTTVTLGITDQLALHYLLEEGVNLIEATPDDPHILWLRNRTLRLHTLPVLRFPSGHVAFVQRLPQRQVRAGGGRSCLSCGHALSLAVPQQWPCACCMYIVGCPVGPKWLPSRELMYWCILRPAPRLQAQRGAICGACHFPAFPQQNAGGWEAGAVQVRRTQQAG